MKTKVATGSDTIGLGDTTAFESWLSSKLDEQNAGKKFRDPTGYRWGAISCGILDFILLIIVIYNYVDADDNLGTKFFLPLSFLIISVIATIILTIIWARIKTENTSMILEALPDNLYQEYFQRVYPNSPLKFDGLKRSRVFPGTYNLNFSIGEEFIRWDIEEHTEERSRRTDDGWETYTVYIMQYTLVASSEKLKGFEEIHMAKRWLKHAPKNPGANEFVSPSMSFNKKYKVTTNNPDKMQVTKLFDPSVIQYFDEMAVFNPHVNHICLGDGLVWFSWTSDDSETPWHVKLDDFAYLNLDQDTAVQQITLKLTRDFNRFYQNFATLRPFDFYHIYPQIN